MDQKERYSSDSVELEYNPEDGESLPLSEFDQYVQSASYMARLVEGIALSGINEQEGLAQIATLRRGGYIANSAFYENIFQMSLKKTKLPELMAEYQGYLARNRNYLALNGLTVKYGKTVDQVFRGNDLMIEIPHYSPDVVLKTIDLHPDNKVDYHFMAGYLHTAESHNLIQNVQIIFTVNERLGKMFRSGK